MKCWSKFVNFHSRKHFWKYRLGNGGNFVSASMSYWHNVLMAHYLVIIITPSGAGFDEYTGTLIIPVYVDDLAPNGVEPVHGHSFIRYINTSRLKPKNRRSPVDILKRIFLNERFFVPRYPMNNIPAVVQIMAWHRESGKLLSEAMMT